MSKCNHEFCVDASCGKCDMMISEVIRSQAHRIAELEAVCESVLAELEDAGFHYPNESICALQDALDIEEEEEQP